MQVQNMWYMIYSEDIENSLPLRKQVRPAHIARLEALKQEGRLLIAGPCPAIDCEDPAEAGFTGSLVVASFADLEQAQAWADADPYKDHGVYSKSIVKPYKKVLP